MRIEIGNDDGIVLDAQDVWIAVIPINQEEPLDVATVDDPSDWIAATWVGATGTTRVARILFGPGGALEKSNGEYKRWYRVEADPEDIKEKVPGLFIVT